ncbi:MAG: PilZ domain-containing protein [Nitrospirota bacterium]|nr:PilZ domain-containing protein [Nitrospirota bacterium]
MPVLFTGEAHGLGTLYDISHGGCKVESIITPPLGASVTLRVTMTTTAQPLVIRGGMVVWAVPQTRFGVRFADLAPNDEGELDRYLTLLNQWFLASPEEGLKDETSSPDSIVRVRDRTWPCTDESCAGAMHPIATRLSLDGRMEHLYMCFTDLDHRQWRVPAK